MMTIADGRTGKCLILLLCDYQYGYGGSNARGMVHYNLHHGVGASPTVHLLVGGLVDNTDDWIDNDRRPRKYGRQEGQEMKCLAGS